MVAPSHAPLHLALLLFAIRAAVGSATGAVGVSSGGQLWCVAKNNAENGALQSAIDWTCGPNGGADCRAIQQGGACYEPPDLQAHASYAFNDYFLRSGGAASPAACDFSGAAALTALNPSHGNCVFPSRYDDLCRGNKSSMLNRRLAGVRVVIDPASANGHVQCEASHRSMQSTWYTSTHGCTPAAASPWRRPGSR